MRMIWTFDVFEAMVFRTSPYGSTTFSPAALTRKAIVSLVLEFLPPLA